MSRHCEQTREMLSLYIDDMLSETEKNEVKHHLDACAACRADYEMLLGIRQSMADMPQLEVSDRFRARLHEKLVAEAEAKAKAKAAPAGRPLWYRLSGTAAAVAVIAVSVIALHNMPKQADLTPKTMTPEATQQATAAPNSLPNGNENSTLTDVIQDAQNLPETAQAEQKTATQTKEHIGQSAKAESPVPIGGQAENTEHVGAADETDAAAAEVHRIVAETATQAPQAADQPSASAAAALSADVSNAADSREDVGEATTDMQTFAAAASGASSQSDSDTGQGFRSGGGSGGGSSAPVAGAASKAAATVQHRLRFVFTVQGCRQAREILQTYAQDGDVYLVPENEAAQITQKLEKLSGCQSYDEEGTAISGGTVRIELSESTN